MPRALLIALLVGLALRLGAVLSVADGPLIVDAAEYAAIGRGIATRGEFSREPGKPTASRSPLYPAFLAVFARLFPDSWTGARIAQAVIDSSTIILVYSFGILAFQRSREALAGAFLYAVHPVYIAYCTEILTETLFFWLWMLTMWLLLEALESPQEKRGASLAAASGAAMGLATLCRPNFLLFPLLCAGTLLAVHRRRSGLLRRLAIATAAAFLVVAPWTARNHRVFGTWTPVAFGGGAAFYYGAQVPRTHNAELEYQVTVGRTEPEADAELYRMAKESYRRNWPRVIADLPGRFLHFWLTSHSALFGVDQTISSYRAQARWGPILLRAVLWALHLAILLLGALGLWSSRKNWTLGCTMTVLAFAYFSLHVFNAYWGNRYHLPALILWLAFAGAAAVRALDRARPLGAPA